MALPIPSLTFADSGMASASGAPIYGAPSYTGGGVWNVATSGSRATNSGSAAAGVPVMDSLSQYIPFAIGGLALVMAWKLLKK